MAGLVACACGKRQQQQQQLRCTRKLNNYTRQQNLQCFRSGPAQNQLVTAAAAAAAANAATVSLLLLLLLLPPFGMSFPRQVPAPGQVQ